MSWFWFPPRLESFVAFKSKSKSKAKRAFDRGARGAFLSTDCY